MDLNLQAGEAVAAVTLSDRVFAQPYNEPLIHQVVTSYLARGRAGTKALKGRADVRGGSAKPWRQKGTGRARAGTTRSPLWRGGGVTFSQRLKNHAPKVNRKAYRGAMRSILSELARQGRLVLVEGFTLDAPKTKALNEKLRALGLADVLIVTEADDDKLELAARNLRGVDVRVAPRVDPVSLVAFDRVLMTVPAARQLEEQLA